MNMSSFPVVEWLVFQVPSERKAQFLQKDREIWTPFLARYSGFLGKTVWIQPECPETVTLVIFWASREQWAAIPQTELERIDQEFHQAVGIVCPLVESKEYWVRSEAKIFAP